MNLLRRALGGRVGGVDGVQEVDSAPVDLAALLLRHRCRGRGPGMAPGVDPPRLVRQTERGSTVPPSPPLGSGGLVMSGGCTQAGGGEVQ